MKEIVAFDRQRSARTKIIIGGPYISQLDRSEAPRAVDDTLKDIGADYYIIDSQGELTLARVMSLIVKGEEVSGIANVVAVTSGSVTRVPREAEDNPINENRVDWSLFDTDAIQPLSMIRTAISCPFACSFCTYPVRAGEHRLADVEVIEAELRELARRGVRYVYFIDDMISDNYFGSPALLLMARRKTGSTAVPAMGQPGEHEQHASHRAASTARWRDPSPASACREWRTPAARRPTIYAARSMRWRSRGTLARPYI